MRFLPMVAAAGLAIAGYAADARTVRVENGYPTGSLALAAIDRGDWATAERLLTVRKDVRANDPARLINLARVYGATGRPAEAIAAYRAALASPHPVNVELGDGSVASTETVARAALAHYAMAGSGR